MSKTEENNKYIEVKGPMDAEKAGQANRKIRKSTGLQTVEGNRLSRQAITSRLGDGKLSLSSKPDYTISLAAQLTVLKVP